MGRPDTVLFFGAGLGDDLLCSTVAHELKKRGGGRIVMFSQTPSLFRNNPDVSAVFKWGYPTVGRLRRWGFNVCIPQYATYDQTTDRDITPNQPALITMCRMAGMSGPVELRPYLYLLKRERECGRLTGNQIVIQSAGLAIMKNKEWLPGRYQEVADTIKSRGKIIQLGLASDPAISGALDLRGKTSVRQSAAILANSKVFIGQAGFLMHLARAVDCRSVIVFGGREDPRVFGYAANENIIGRTDCSPCWQRTKCDYDHQCMRQIEVAQVVEAVERQLDRTVTSLPLEVTEI